MVLPQVIVTKESEKRFTSRQRCEHCGNIVPLEIVGEYSGVASYDDYPLSDMTWEAGDIYQLLWCPACKDVSLRSYYWHSEAMDPSDIVFNMLFPGPQGCPLGVPERIARAYDAARKVRSVDANAYGVLLGRLLELVCQDREASGASLAERLEDLASRGEFPRELIGVADGLRNLRNVGAHAFLGELTPAELPIMDNLCRAILEYVYSAPFLARQAEECLERVRAEHRSGSRVVPESTVDG